MIAVESYGISFAYFWNNNSDEYSVKLIIKKSLIILLTHDYGIDKLTFYWWHRNQYWQNELKARETRRLHSKDHLGNRAVQDLLKNSQRSQVGRKQVLWNVENAFEYVLCYDWESESVWGKQIASGDDV